MLKGAQDDTVSSASQRIGNLLDDAAITRSVKYKIPVCKSVTEIPVVRRYLLRKFSYGRYNITLSRSHVVDVVDRTGDTIDPMAAPLSSTCSPLRSSRENRPCQECPTEDFNLLTIHSTCFIERFTTVTQAVVTNDRLLSGFDDFDD